MKKGNINVKTVIIGILKGKKYKDIAEEAGSLAVSDNSKEVAIAQSIRTNKYMKEAEPYIKVLTKERDRAIKALTEMNPKSIDYDKLTSSLDKMTKMIELLSGNATERNEIDIKDVKEFLKKA